MTFRNPLVLFTLSALLVATGMSLMISPPSLAQVGAAATPNTVSLSTVHPTPPSLTARAAIIYDVTTQKALYIKNADTQLPLASITKVMTALVATETLGTNAVRIDPAALTREGESGFTAGEEWYAKDLIDFTLITSSNDGAEALKIAAEPFITALHTARFGSSFIARMNERAQALHMTQTYYLDATGLDISETQASAYGSALDTAKLFSYVYRHHPSLLAGTAEDGVLIDSADGGLYTAHNTNDALPYISGLIGGKTGYTDLAGGNLAVLFDAGLGQPIVVVVLGSTRTARFSDVSALVAYTRTLLSTQPE